MYIKTQKRYSLLNIKQQNKLILYHDTLYTPLEWFAVYSMPYTTTSFLSKQFLDQKCTEENQSTISKYNPTHNGYKSCTCVPHTQQQRSKIKHKK